MERSTNDNLEQFLQENAEQFRIHPSEKVWEGISQNINKRRRKYFFFGLATLLTVTSSLGYLILNAPAPGILKNIVSNKTSSSDTKEQVNTKFNSITDSFERSTQLIAESKKLPVQKSKSAKIISINASTKDLITEKANNNITSEETKKEKEGWLANSINADKGVGLLRNINHLQSSLIKDIRIASTETKTAENSTKVRSRQSKFSMMFFFTPTVSYRKLSENKSYLRSAPVGSAISYGALYDVNNAVTHKPDIGLEVGLAGKYNLTKNVKLRAGVQFNINRYDIKAFRYVPEVATIALNSGYGVDSLNTISNYRNFNGGKSDWLQNFYFQISAPVGAEIRLGGSDKTYIGVAGTVQPTYLIGDRAYIITTDYKNYAQVPWLVRRWNVNTNLETFVAYSTGKLNWQVGPQVRYQLLSSFVNEYPVKENLFDFGLKVGISLNQNH